MWAGTGESGQDWGRGKVGDEVCADIALDVVNISLCFVTDQNLDWHGPKCLKVGARAESSLCLSWEAGRKGVKTAPPRGKIVSVVTSLMLTVVTHTHTHAETHTPWEYHKHGYHMPLHIDTRPHTLA